MKIKHNAPSRLGHMVVGEIFEILNNDLPAGGVYMKISADPMSIPIGSCTELVVKLGDDPDLRSCTGSVLAVGYVKELDRDTKVRSLVYTSVPQLIYKD